VHTHIAEIAKSEHTVVVKTGT